MTNLANFRTSAVDFAATSLDSVIQCRPYNPVPRRKAAFFGFAVRSTNILPAGFVTDCDRTTNPTEREEPASGSHLLGIEAAE